MPVQGLGEHYETWANLLTAKAISEEAQILQDKIGGIVNCICRMRTVRVNLSPNVGEPPAISELRYAKSKAYKKGCKSYQFLSNLLNFNTAKYKESDHRCVNIY